MFTRLSISSSLSLPIYIPNSLSLVSPRVFWPLIVRRCLCCWYIYERACAPKDRPSGENFRSALRQCERSSFYSAVSKAEISRVGRLWEFNSLSLYIYILLFFVALRLLYTTRIYSVDVTVYIRYFWMTAERTFSLFFFARPRSALFSSFFPRCASRLVLFRLVCALHAE